MTNRFFRNAVGVAALTSLALGLACSGSSDPDPVAPPATVNKPGTPIVTISGLPASNNAITKHQYLISASDPSGLATSFTATGNNGGTLNAVSGASGMWMYIPQKEGNEIITVKGTNSAGTSDGGGVMASVVLNRQPSMSTGTTIAPGNTRTVSLPDVDADGDLVTWAVTDKAGLNATVNSDGSGPLTIVIAADAKADNYTLKLTSTEKHPTAKYIVDNTQVHTFIVKVSAEGGGDGIFDWHQGDTRGQVHAFPNNLDQAALGVPFTFQFNAGDPFVPSNQITEWHVNGGLSPFNADGENIAPSESWIGQPFVNGADGKRHYLRPAIGSIGPEFERWRLGIDYQKQLPNNREENFPGGRFYFVSGEGGNYLADTYSSKVLFGVRADFANDGVLAYQDFYVRVTKNTEPDFYGDHDYTLLNKGKVEITVLNKRTGQAEFGGVTDPRADNVPAAVPWAGKFSGSKTVPGIGVKYENENRLVFRHAYNEYSYDMTAKIDLSDVVIYDPDFAGYGDVILFVLDGVSYGDNRRYESGGGYSSSLANDGITTIYTSKALPWDANTDNKLKGTKFDVTSVVRPLLRRPYPINGADRDATRLYTGQIYHEDFDADYFEDGVHKSIYQAHAGPENANSVNVGETDYNAKGNLMAFSDDGKLVYPGAIEFVKVPKVTDFDTFSGTTQTRGLNGNEGLTFHYTAIDLGGNKLPFQVYVPTRPNWAPQIDTYQWNPAETGYVVGDGGATTSGTGGVGQSRTSGDIMGERAINMPEVWASLQPTELQTTTWGIRWNSTSAGVTNGKYYLNDRPYNALAASSSTANGFWSAVTAQGTADPVYLMIPETTQVSPQGGPTNVVSQAKPDTMHAPGAGGFEFNWKPTLYQGRKSYAYTIYGWDKYGAGMRPFTMGGNVWGSLTGTPIYKTIYNNGEPFYAGPADLTINGFARVSVNPFFAAGDGKFPYENRMYNQYGLDANESFLSINQGSLATPWEVRVIPPNTPVLISAARTSAGSGATIDLPVIGPSVLSDDWTKVGKVFKTFDGDSTMDAKTAAGVGPMNWETGNLISYAYINPMAAEDSAGTTDPSQRIRVDLTAHVGSGQLALLTDPSLNKKRGKANVYTIEGVEAPKPWGLKDESGYASTTAGEGTFDYYGLMHGIGATGLLNDGVIQIVMPSAGQSAFYYANEDAPATDHAYPSADYANHLGWFNTTQVATEASNNTANLGGSFEPIVLPVHPADSYAAYAAWTTGDTSAYGAVPSAAAYGLGLPYTFHIGNDGTPNYTLVSLKRGTTQGKFYEDDDFPRGIDANLPVWRVERTGVPTRLMDNSVVDFDNDLHFNTAPGSVTDAVYNVPDKKADDNEMYLAHESAWDDLKEDTFGTFEAYIDRDSFGVWLWYYGPIASDDIELDEVVETLQVVSYISGTELGPDNHQALPVLLEFGNINQPIIAYEEDGVTPDHTLYLAGQYDLGSFPLYKPSQWHTPIEGDKSIPVASYIVRYTDPATGLSGSMGVITDDLESGIDIWDFAPIRALRITTLANNASTPANTAAEWVNATNQNGPSGSLRSTAISGLAGNNGWAAPPALVNAKAFNDNGGTNNDTSQAATGLGHYKVSLTWSNPANVLSSGPVQNRPALSGNIIEFFNAADFDTADATKGPSALPIYKVYVGPGIAQFSIPDAWLPYLGYQGDGTTFSPIGDAPTTVLVRVRSVRYGDRYKPVDSPGAFVNFNRSPFKQALPAVWMDSLSAPISFADLGSNKIRNITAESIYEGFRDGSTITVSGFNTAGATATVANTTIPALTATAIGTSMKMTNPDADSLTGTVTYAWDFTPGEDITIECTGDALFDTADVGPYIIDQADVTIAAGGTMNPTVAIVNTNILTLFDGTNGDIGTDTGGGGIVVNVPLTLTVTYQGSTDAAPVRTRTQTFIFKYTVTSTV